MAERQMLAFVPDKEVLTPEFPIKCLKISPVQEKFAQPLTHRDYLGAVLNTGIDRKLTGDIFIHDYDAFLLCHESITEYLINNLSKVRHNIVKVNSVPCTEISYSNSLQECAKTVSSPRIDCIVSAITNLSRQKAQDLIQKEMVSMDHKIIIHNDLICEANQLLSIRGYGRFRIQEVNEVTKKGKLKLKYIKYL